MDDLMKSLERVRNDLHVAMKMLRQNGNEMAKAEASYQAVKYQTAMKLRAEGMPVTMIEAIIKGHPDVNEKLFERMTARVLYESNKESINVSKKDLDVINDQISREWHSGDL